MRGATKFRTGFDGRTATPASVWPVYWRPWGAAGAAAAYERVVAHEPLHEEAHRGMLRTLAVAGRRAHAIRHFERLIARLEDLELDPEQETLELYERIRKADFAGS